MRCAALILGAGIGVFAMTATASSDSYYEYADVVDVEPLIERQTVVEPREVCSVASHPTTRYERRYHRRYDRYQRHAFDRDYGHSGNWHGNGAATLIGGVLGGLVGSQFGGGNGKKALAITGAMVGASIANRASRRRHESYHTGYGSSHYPPRCTTVMDSREVEEIAGYRVHYLYQGQEFVKRVEHDPGDRIRVRVQVTPIADGSAW
jgi:uncharacterized protein YcfJ